MGSRQRRLRVSLMPQPLPSNIPNPSDTLPTVGIQDALRKWEHVFQRACWGIAITEGDAGRLDWINRAYAEMHGYTVEELQGRPILDLYATERHDEVRELVRTALETDHLMFESEHRRKDGSLFPVEVDVSVLRDPDGRALCHAAYLRDISERRRSEVALRQSETLSRTRLA